MSIEQGSDYTFMHYPSPNAYHAAIDLLLYVNHTKHYQVRESALVVDEV